MKPKKIASALAGLLVLIAGTAPARASEPNDDIVGTTVIVDLPFRAEQSTREATVEPGEPGPCFEYSHSLWYRWTAPTDLLVVADTRGSNFDAAITVYRGSGPFDLEPADCDDDSLGDQAIIRLEADAGQTYYFQVGSVFGARGDLIFNLSPPASISGTVVDAASLDPLSDVCVDVFDASRNRRVGEGFTDLDGLYLIADLPVVPVKVRFRDCADAGPSFEGKQRVYKTQWYTGKKTFDLADPIALEGGLEVTNIDAALAARARPDVAVADVTIEDVPISIGPAGETPISTGAGKRIVVEVANSGPVSPRWTSITVDACPRSIGSCQRLGTRYVTVPAGSSSGATFAWNATELVGDVTIVVVVDLNEDADWANNIHETPAYVHAGGTGFGVRVAV